MRAMVRVQKRLAIRCRKSCSVFSELSPQSFSGESDTVKFVKRLKDLCSGEVEISCPQKRVVKYNRTKLLNHFTRGKAKRRTTPPLLGIVFTDNNRVETGP